MSDEHEENIITKISKHVDSHIRVFQYGIYLIGAIGLGVVFRGIRISSKFRSVKDIPPEFISKNISLLGIVKNIQQKKLVVNHVPIFSFRETNETGDLKIEIAGVILTSEGECWLQKHIQGHKVWFKLIGKDDSGLCCIVSRAWIWPKAPLNVSLVRSGLATVRLPEGRYVSSPVYQKLYQNLIRAERWADEHGQGVWRKQSVWQKMKEVLQFVQKKQNLLPV